MLNSTAEFHTLAAINCLMTTLIKYKFEEFEADLRAAELRKGGTRLKLQMQPFQVLVALLERPKEVVTREELRQRLWPQDTFVDFDHGLNTAMVKLRDVLGDSASKPKFIETIAKRGYRFLGSAEVVSDQPAMSERAEVSWGLRNAPRSVHGLVMLQAQQQIAVEIEHIDEAEARAMYFVFHAG